MPVQGSYPSQCAYLPPIEFSQLQLLSNQRCDSDFTNTFNAPNQLGLFHEKNFYVLLHLLTDVVQLAFKRINDVLDALTTLRMRGIASVTLGDEHVTQLATTDDHGGKYGTRFVRQRTDIPAAVRMTIDDLSELCQHSWHQAYLFWLNIPLSGQSLWPDGD
ncbi:Uncharacterised protein [Klebsiella variicola]|nr:Uncharacterised protein [Klebsiella variicola]